MQLPLYDEEKGRGSVGIGFNSHTEAYIARPL